MDKKEKAIFILRALGSNNPMSVSEIWMKIHGEERVHQPVVRQMLENEMLRRGHVTAVGEPRHRRWAATSQGRQWLRKNDPEETR